jgi:hypothetical protein
MLQYWIGIFWKVKKCENFVKMKYSQNEISTIVEYSQNEIFTVVKHCSGLIEVDL